MVTIQPYEVGDYDQEPVKLADVKSFLKLPHNRDDALLKGLIKSATKAAETYTGRDFLIKPYTTYRDVFGDVGEFPIGIGSPINYDYNFTNSRPIVLRKSPLVDITEINYLVNGSTVILDPSLYRIIKNPFFSSIIPTGGKDWPMADYEQQSITITFTAGYESIPEDIKDAICSIIADQYVNRGDSTEARGIQQKELPIEATSTLNRYVIRSMAPC